MGRGLGLLCALVLLSLGDKAKGELCRAWTYEMELTTRVFQCPGKLDAALSKFCCGTCSAPYCCSLRASRLDQAECSAEQKAWRDTDTAPTRNVSPQTLRDLMNVVWIGMGAVIALILINWGCACRGNVLRWLRLNPEWLRLNWDWLRMFHPDPQGQWWPQQMELVARGPGAGGARSRPLDVGSPAPYGAYLSPDPPPYSAEDSWAVQFRHAIEENSENSEDEVLILPPPPIPPRPDPVRTVGRTLEEEMIAEPPLEEEGETA